MSQPPQGTGPQYPHDPQNPQDGQASAPQSPSGYSAQEPAVSPDPYGQPPAATSGEQDAWGTQSAPSAPQPGTPSPAWGSAQSPAAAPQPGEAASAGAAPSGSAPSGGSATGEAGFLRALFDFRFEHFITVKFSSFLYIIAFVVAGLIWLSNIISGIMFGAVWGSMNSFFGEPSFNAVPLILAILFGWIPSVIALIAMRLGLEFAVATIRTAQHTRRIADSAEQR